MKKRAYNIGHVILSHATELFHVTINFPNFHSTIGQYFQDLNFYGVNFPIHE